MGVHTCKTSAWIGDGVFPVGVPLRSPAPAAEGLPRPSPIAAATNGDMVLDETGLERDPPGMPSPDPSRAGPAARINPMSNPRCDEPLPPSLVRQCWPIMACDVRGDVEGSTFCGGREKPGGAVLRRGRAGWTPNGGEVISIGTMLRTTGRNICLACSVMRITDISSSRDNPHCRVGIDE